MGIFSCCVPNVKKGGSKAKLVLEDGRLEEFSTRVKVSEVLKRNGSNSTCFICDADDIDFDEYVHPLQDNYELQLGQLYFELPSYWLKSQLSADQMGALAAKASMALNINDGCDRAGLDRCCCCGLTRRRIDPLEFICNEADEEEALPITASGIRGRGKRLFDRTQLVAILEEDGDEDQVCN